MKTSNPNVPLSDSDLQHMLNDEVGKLALGDSFSQFRLVRRVADVVTSLVTAQTFRASANVIKAMAAADNVGDTPAEAGARGAALRAAEHCLRTMAKQVCR